MSEDRKESNELSGVENRAFYYNPLGNGCNVKIFNGGNLLLGNGWKTRNNSTLVLQMSDSIILMHNGSADFSQVNVLHTIKNIERLKGRIIYISVEARVHQLTKKKVGGVLAFIMGNDYNKGNFYKKVLINNVEWENKVLSIEIDDEIVKEGGTVCLRSYVEGASSAVVEYRNFCISCEENEIVMKDKEFREKDIDESWKIIPDIVVGSERRKRFMERYQRVLCGYKIANRIICGNDSVHYWVLAKHIGDALILNKSVLIKKYVKGIEKLIVITNSLNAGVAKLFSSIDAVISLEKDELEMLELYAASGMNIHKNLHRDEYGVAFDRIGVQYCRVLFGVSGTHWEWNLPNRALREKDLMNSVIHVPEDSIASAYKILKEDGFCSRSTVIICPYAQSSSTVSERQWEVLVNYLNQKKYKVYTNTGKKEREIKGTKRLFVPVDVFAALSVIGCAVIGVQSGIIDVIRALNKDVRLIDLAVLLTSIDNKFARDRKVSKDIDRKGNITHICIGKDQLECVGATVIENFKYWEKGDLQKELFVKCRADLKSEENENLNDYFYKLRQRKNLMIFMSVFDSANKYWSKVDISCLGLTSDLSLSWRRSYVAVVDTDNDFRFEQMGEDCKEILFQGDFPDVDFPVSSGSLPRDNQYYVYSHAMGKNHYTKAAIVINGQNYSQSGRGLNIVVYDKKIQQVVDSAYIDLWADETLKLKRKDIGS